jgi:sugar phosphate isomerase/epimerase
VSDITKTPGPQHVAGNVASGTDLSLEDIIVRANRIGVEYVEKRREAERLELLRPSVRAQVMNRIESSSSERLSENRLRRLAEADAEYLDHIERLAEARAEAEKLRVRYESYRNLFDARRTLISYRKAELRALS